MSSRCLSGEPIVPLDLATLAQCRPIPWDALFEGDLRMHARRAAPRKRSCRRSAASTRQPHQLDARIEEVLQILRDDGHRHADAR